MKNPSGVVFPTDWGIEVLGAILLALLAAVLSSA